MRTNPHVEHRFELELTVPGTPEQVWRAIASAEGVSAWMMPARFEPRAGAALAFDMGPLATSHGRVTAYEPIQRFAYEEDWATLGGHPGADVTPLVTEFLVESRAGGTCVVRVVTSAFGTGADWENEFWEEMTTGWAPILGNLHLYLASFPDQQATALWVGAEFSASPAAAIDAIRHAVGAGSPGDPVTVRDIDGRLERSVERHILVRVEHPVAGFVSFFSYASDNGAGVILQGYLFGEGAHDYADREKAGWQAWLDDVSSTTAAPA
jgi:uncharacterized protein YndB with AHSA1/START domain